MKQLKKQISEKEETTSTPKTNLLTLNEFPLIKKLLKGLLALIFLAIVSVLTTALLEVPSKAMNSSNTEMEKSEMENSLYISKVRDYSEEKLITEVDLYMKSIAPTEKLNAALLVELCGKYQIDITLVIAQAILESHIGTKGRAVQTNSVWNVGTYDNGVIHYTYSHPNESIEPYLKLIKERYLIKITAQGDTLQREVKNLIADRGYVNYEGKRYATNPTYENTLRYWLIRVQMDSNIKLYQDIKAMPDEDILGFFVPREEAVDTAFLANL
jgi:flagellum-specific peptidoglycan hydrolase FlgJ